MSALPLRTGDTADLLRSPAVSVPHAKRWPYRIAVPFIMLASFALWAVVWRAASFTIAALTH